MPHYFFGVARARRGLEAVCVALWLCATFVSFSQSAVYAQTSQHGGVLSDCWVLKAVRNLASEASQSDLTKARERLDFEQSTSNLPQFSALWRELPGGEDAERELEVLVSIPLAVPGKRQGKDQKVLDRWKKSMDLRTSVASLLEGALTIYYELSNISQAINHREGVRKAWARTVVLLDRLPKHGPERNLLQVTLALEQDRLDEEIETLDQRKRSLVRRLGELLGWNHLDLPGELVSVSMLRVPSGVESRALPSVHIKGPELWKSALAGVQVQVGATALWTQRRARLGYYLGVTYTPTSRSVFRSLQTQTQVHQLERNEILDGYELRHSALERQRRELLISNQRLALAQRVGEASRVKVQKLLEQEPSEIDLAYLTNRIQLIRSVYRMNVRELRDLRHARFWKVKLLGSHAIVSGLETIECEGVDASFSGVTSRTAFLRRFPTQLVSEFEALE